MPNQFTLRVMWRDTLTRRNKQISDLDAATQALITDFETMETAFNAKVASYETAKQTADTLQKELMAERLTAMTDDSSINRAIIMQINANGANLPNP